MLTVYVFSLIVSGGLLGIAIFSDFLDVDFGDVDVDADLDIDTQVDTDVQAFKIVSIRGLLYFLLGFGLVGTALSLLWGGDQAGLTAAAAGTSGVVAGAAATAIFNWLKRSDSGARLQEGSFVGLVGRMTVPFGDQLLGQVRVVRGDRAHDLVAIPFDADARSPGSWTEVVVVEMKNGRALVVPENEGLLPSGE